jgi:hypothetical protein
VRFAHVVANPLGQYRFKPTNTWNQAQLGTTPSCAYSTQVNRLNLWKKLDVAKARFLGFFFLPTKH